MWTIIFINKMKSFWCCLSTEVTGKPVLYIHFNSNLVPGSKMLGRQWFSLISTEFPKKKKMKTEFKYFFPNFLFFIVVLFYLQHCGSFWGYSKVNQLRCCLVCQSCPALCDARDCSMPGLSVPHHLPNFAQVHVHCISDAIQPSHSLTPSSPSALSLSQHQGLFQ